MNKNNSILRRKKRVRKKISGTDKTPRLSIYKSNRNIQMQLIDDQSNKTLLGCSSIKSKEKSLTNKSKEVCTEFLKKYKILFPKSEMKLVFDRNGMKYHGVVKNIAEELRKGGLKF